MTEPHSQRVVVHISGALVTSPAGTRRTVVQASSVGEVLTALCSADEGLGRRVLLPDGRPRQNVVISIGGQVCARHDLDRALKEGDEVTILTAFSGG